MQANWQLHCPRRVLQAAAAALDAAMENYGDSCPEERIITKLHFRNDQSHLAHSVQHKQLKGVSVRGDHSLAPPRAESLCRYSICCASYGQVCGFRVKSQPRCSAEEKQDTASVRLPAPPTHVSIAFITSGTLKVASGRAGRMEKKMTEPKAQTVSIAKNMMSFLLPCRAARWDTTPRARLFLLFSCAALHASYRACLQEPAGSGTPHLRLPGSYPLFPPVPTVSTQHAARREPSSPHAFPLRFLLASFTRGRSSCSLEASSCSSCMFTTPCVW